MVLSRASEQVLPSFYKTGNWAIEYFSNWHKMIFFCLKLSFLSSRWIFSLKIPGFLHSTFSIEEIYGINQHFTTEGSLWERYVLIPKWNDLLRELKLNASCMLGLLVSALPAGTEKFQHFSLQHQLPWARDCYYIVFPPAPDTVVNNKRFLIKWSNKCLLYWNINLCISKAAGNFEIWVRKIAQNF